MQVMATRAVLIIIHEGKELRLTRILLYDQGKLILALFFSKCPMHFRFHPSECVSHLFILFASYIVELSRSHQSRSLVIEVFEP